MEAATNLGLPWRLLRDKLAPTATNSGVLTPQISQTPKTTPNKTQNGGPHESNTNTEEIPKVTASAPGVLYKETLAALDTDIIVNIHFIQYFVVCNVILVLKSCV